MLRQSVKPRRWFLILYHRETGFPGPIEGGVVLASTACFRHDSCTVLGGRPRLSVLSHPEPHPAPEWNRLDPRAEECSCEGWRDGWVRSACPSLGFGDVGRGIVGRLLPAGISPRCLKAGWVSGTAWRGARTSHPNEDRIDLNIRIVNGYEDS